MFLGTLWKNKNEDVDLLEKESIPEGLVVVESSDYSEEQEAEITGRFVNILPGDDQEWVVRVLNLQKNGNGSKSNI